MHSFKDRKDRTWQIDINVAAVKQVRGLLGLDLYALIDDGAKALDKLLGDPVQLVDTIYCLCKEQADTANVTDEDFGRAFSGDVLQAAAEAFLSELTSFFPDPRARATLRKLMTKGKEAGAILFARAEEEVDRLDVALLVEMLSSSSGNAPASSASTPAPSHSAP